MSGSEAPAVEADPAHAIEPAALDILGAVDQIGTNTLLFGQLAQSIGMGAVDGTHHQHQIDRVGKPANGVLTMLGGVADVVLARPLDVREQFAQCVDDGSS